MCRFLCRKLIFRNFGSGRSRVAGLDPIGRGDGQPGQGEAGEESGGHAIEVDVSLEELARILGEELQLPNIQPKGINIPLVGRVALFDHP